MEIKMQVSAATHTGLTADRRPRTTGKSSSTGRALVVVDKPATPSRRSVTGRSLPRSTAFLAHLSLQYDDLATRRRERSERLSHALAGYSAKRQPEFKPTLRVSV